jgi:anti-anti-sigma regulatory factor
VILVRWRRGRAQQAVAPERPPLVLTVTDPVNRETASELVARVGRIAATDRVVVDLTAIPDFDTEGAAALVGLQESLGPQRLTIVGFRQATARLVGIEDLSVLQAPEQRSETADDHQSSTDDLEPVLDEALTTGAGIVVVDLRGAELTMNGLQSIAFASSSAAVNGQELLVVNVDANSGERLRRAGLSATTFVAPEPIIDG